MIIRIAQTPAELVAHEVAWSALAEQATDRNPFYEYWMLAPAMRYLPSAEVEIIFVYDNETLSGVFPLCRRSKLSALSLNAEALWRHEHCALAQPLVRIGTETAVLDAFLSWWEARGCSEYFLFDYLDGESVIAHAIRSALSLRERRVFELESFARAAYRPNLSVEEYLKQGLPRHRRKEFSRLRKRFEEQGEVRVVILNTQDSIRDGATEAQVEQWVQQFIILESAGWKGVDGGALGRLAGEEGYFRAVCQAAYHRRALLLMHLEFTGKPVAMKCDIISGNSVFTYKIAYDEQFAKFSPGVLLELEHMRYFETMPQITLLDSCAVAGHPMIDRLWQERRQILSLLTHREGIVRQAVVGTVLPTLRNLRHRMKCLRRVVG